MSNTTQRKPHTVPMGLSPTAGFLKRSVEKIAPKDDKLVFVRYDLDGTNPCGVSNLKQHLYDLRGSVDRAYVYQSVRENSFEFINDQCYGYIWVRLDKHTEWYPERIEPFVNRSKFAKMIVHDKEGRFKHSYKSEKKCYADYAEYNVEKQVADPDRDIYKPIPIGEHLLYFIPGTGTAWYKRVD